MTSADSSVNSPMLRPDPENPLFQLAVRFVNETGQHIFLTGKAGTGKTTFLKHVTETTTKKWIVVAPTGVAAINAGGVTMHSFFQLPLGPFIPITDGLWGSQPQQGTDYHTLLKNIRFTSEKRRLLQELDLLIIDEVSMLRADMLDAMDVILRHFRKKPMQAFGGVQVLFIGDLFQLPPVVKPDEWSILNQYYATPFFFDAHAIRQRPPLYIELNKIYRQSDHEFISLLNNIRNNCALPSDFTLLNGKFKSEFQAPPAEHYITLTTHNSKADTINFRELQKLPGRSYSFTGDVKGEFSEKSFPADMTIELKVGAQVMFIRNDKGEDRRFYNGKLGIVSKLLPDKIFVKTDSKEIIELERETWKNIRYHFDTVQSKIREEELGSFTQYPIRLAWAITIHKSQGLTFEKAIIDAGSSFAAGQVYVALSRLTSLDGLVLGSPITPSAVNTDERVIAFTRSAQTEDALTRSLEEERDRFVVNRILECFGLQREIASAEDIQRELEHWNGGDLVALVVWCDSIATSLQDLVTIAARFSKQLDGLTKDKSDTGRALACERVHAACAYFASQLDPLYEKVDFQSKKLKVKKHAKKLSLKLLQLQKALKERSSKLDEARSLARNWRGDNFPTEVKEVTVPNVQIEIPRTEKGASRRISLEMYRSGNSIEEIALERGLTKDTIMSHIYSFIQTGEVELGELVPDEKISRILEAVMADPERNNTSIKLELGDDYDFHQIRAVRKIYEAGKAGEKNPVI